MRTIDRDQLRHLIDTGGPVRVVSALGPQRYQAAHIPGSETFADHREALANLCTDELIVVHGTNVADPSYRWAARILESNGYLDVRCYVGGLADWCDAGLPLAGTGRLTAQAA